MRVSKARRLVVWILVLVVSFIILWPIYWIVKSSFTSSTELYLTPIRYLPVNLTLASYIKLFSASNMKGVFANTLIITAFTLILSTVLCGLAGYAFGRTVTRGLSLAFTYLLFSTMIPATTTLIPLTILWRTLKLTDTFPGLILLYFSSVIPFTTMIVAGIVKQIPVSLEEAAMMDGATRMRIFFTVILPLLKPAVATLCIINFISCINEFYIPLNFSMKYTKVLSTITATIPRVNEYNMPWDMISAIGTIMLAPSILFVVFFEKNILEGLMAGSIKQ